MSNTDSTLFAQPPSRLASWFTRVVDEKEREVLFYADHLRVPDDVQPRIPNFLPFPFADRAFQENLQSITEVVAKNFIKDLGLYPFAIYTPGLYALLNTNHALGAKATSAEEPSQVRPTLCAFEVWRFYRYILNWFEAHVMRGKSANWDKRHQATAKLATQQTLNVLQHWQDALQKIPGFKEVVVSGDPIPYNKELAQQLTDLLFAVTVAHIRILELAICEMALIDPVAAERDGMFCVSERPKERDVTAYVQSMCNDHERQLVKYCNDTTKLQQFDMDHIAEHGMLSVVFQNTMFMMRPCKESDSETAVSVQ